MATPGSCQFALVLFAKHEFRYTRPLEEVVSKVAQAEAEWTLQTFSCSGKSICRDVWREPKMLLQLWDVACLCIARTGAKHTSYWRVTQRRCCHGQELRATCKWMSIPFAIPLRIFRIFRIHSSTAQVPAHRV